MVRIGVGQKGMETRVSARVQCIGCGGLVPRMDGPTHRYARMRELRSRALLVAGAGLFVVSSLFPVAASLLRVDRLPTWVGVADVALAGCLVAGLAIVSRKPRSVEGVGGE